MIYVFIFKTQYELCSFAFIVIIKKEILSCKTSLNNCENESQQGSTTASPAPSSDPNSAQRNCDEIVIQQNNCAEFEDQLKSCQDDLQLMSEGQNKLYENTINNLRVCWNYYI